MNRPDLMSNTVVHLITSLENGGAQEVIKTICDQSSLTHKHVVFYMTGENAYQGSDTSLGVAKKLNVAGVCSLMAAIIQLLKLLKATHTPVCVQGWMYQGNFLALVLKIFSPRTPVVFSIHNGSDRWRLVSLSGYIGSRICGLFSGLASSTIFVSKSSLDAHVSYKNSRVIPNPLRVLASEAAMSKHAVAPMVTLACVARFDPIKNIGFMLNVIQDLCIKGLSIRLLMAGEGMSANNQELKRMIETRNLESVVVLLGVVRDVSEVYLQADYTILTSSCESFSNVLLESISTGTPFISSDVGVAADLVSPESLVIQGFNLSHWSKALESRLQQRKTPDVSESVKCFYKKISATYRPEKVASLYIDCWAKAVGH